MTTSARITGPELSESGKNPLKGLLDFGQSPWMDYIRRDLLTGGELKKLIHEDGLRGMTSNPSIFAKAISSSKDYSDILESAGRENYERHAALRKNRRARRAGCRRHFPAGV